MHRCDECAKPFASKKALNQHLRQKHKKEPTLSAPKYKCGHCDTEFSTTSNLLRHLRSQHASTGNFRCNSCSTIFGTQTVLDNHLKYFHSLNLGSKITERSNFGESVNASCIKSALKSSFIVYRLDLEPTDIEPFNYLVSNTNPILSFINNKLPSNGSTRVGLTIHVQLTKPLEGETVIVYFHTRMERFGHELIEDDFNHFVDQLISQLNVFCTGGSGWVVETLLAVEIKVASPVNDSGSSFIETPELLRGLGNSILNIKNKNDEFCFLYSVLAALYPQAKHSERPASYMSFVDNLQYKTQDFPMCLSKIPFFEKRNNLSITVYCLENESLQNVYHSKNRRSKTRIRLLLLRDGTKSHYCLIKNFSNIMHKLHRSASKRSKGPKSKFCGNCFQAIVKKNFQKHVEFCEDNKPLEIQMPKAGKTLTFNNWQKTQWCPFVVYADLEAIDVPSESDGSTKSNTTEIERQYPASFGAVLFDQRSNSLAETAFYKGENCIEHLMETLRRWLSWTYSEKQKHRFLNISKSERVQLLSGPSTNCCICGEDVDHSERVIHHCHLTGHIFGVAHSQCNLKARTVNFIPVFFHNLARYDAHHIVKNLILKKNEKLSAISRTDEVYISFSITVPVGSYTTKKGKVVKVTNSLRFLDSFQFMAQSLESLAKTLKQEDFHLLRHYFNSTNPQIDWTLLTEKGFFPYSYLDSFEKFNQPLPSFGDSWKNTLTGKIDITEAQYNKALHLYNQFQCQSLGDYHDIYLKTDVLILADVFQLFRKVCMKVYCLDPAHFFSAPNLSWEAMLITTRATLGLLTDVDMLLFFERSIRGGINGIGELRHFEANNQHLGSFDPTKPSVYGAFFDVTSLYAGTMQQMLPLDGYTWNDSITLSEILNTADDSDFGYFVEVDLQYPSSLHDQHNDLPLAPEKLTINPSWLSTFARSFGIKTSSDGPKKLIETLFDKNNYVCHYRNLKFYVKHGLKVKRLHRVIQFKQSRWLGDYISKNTIMRKQAINDFEKNFYKLMSNACFGKTMENLRNRREILFVNNKEQATKSLQKPTFKGFQIIHDGLVSVTFSPNKVLWSKPTPVGASILDLSKLSLYKFHYEQMKPRYGAKLKVCYKDTDSLLYRIETTDLYADMLTFKHLLDLSDYPESHFLHDKSNKKVPLTMTDELQGKVLNEIICLRSKLYSIQYEGGVKQSAKGVQKSVKKTLHHDLFKSCLFDQKPVRRSMTQLKSENHQIVVNRVNKVAVSSYDDKRYLLQDGVRSLAYGHYSLENCTLPG